jgi:hypothetical protein
VRQSTLRIAGLSAIRTLPDLSTRVEGLLLPGLCNTDVFFTSIRWTMPDPDESLYGRDVSHQYGVEIVSALLVSMNPGCLHAEQVRQERCPE